MPYLTYLTFFVPPLIGAIVGYSTNWLAVTMLFRPFKEKRLFGRTLPFTPGLIVKERARLAKKMGETFGRKILTPEVIAREIGTNSLWEGFRKDTLAEMFAHWGLAPPVVYAENFLTWLRKQDKPIGELLPAQIFEAVKEALRKYLPQAAGRIEQWPVDYPHIDAQFAQWVQKVVKENVGRFAGLFVDADKIYTSIKEGLVEYLSQEENQDFVYEKASAAIDRFKETQHIPMPNDPGTAQQWVDWAEKVLLVLGEKNEVKKQEKKAALKRTFEKAAAYGAQRLNISQIIENRINALDPRETEALIMSVIRRELHLIMALGGILGFVIGWIPALLSLFY